MKNNLLQSLRLLVKYFKVKLQSQSWNGRIGKAL